MQNPFDLAGKVTFITGSSRGIGAAIARTLSHAGARIIINYVDDPAGKNHAEAKTIAAEVKAIDLLPCDVGDHAQTGKLMDRISAEHQGLDILINNAGILRDRTLKKMSAAEWDEVIRVNLTGTFNCTSHATRILRPGGRIVNISSVNAYMGFFGTANYAASKAGVTALTKVAARELARQQITVNAIAPGFVETEMTRTILPEVALQYRAQIPLGRFAAVEDIANAALFLCSPAASYITGQVIHVNGGFLMD